MRPLRPAHLGIDKSAGGEIEPDLGTDGKLFTCLFATDGFDLRMLLRSGYDDDQIANAIKAIWSRRADRYSEIRSANTPRSAKVEMSYIGG